MTPKAKRWLIVLTVPVAYALFMRVVFDLHPFRDFMTVMSISFFFTVPFGIGYLTVMLSPWEYVKKGSYPALAPWIPIFFFLFVTLTMRIEGWAGWIMKDIQQNILQAIRIRSESKM
jgi:hypothetical protein